MTLRTIPVPAPNCAHCGTRDWRNTDEPQKVYPITANDKRFLKSLRIEAYDEKRSE